MMVMTVHSPGLIGSLYSAADYERNKQVGTGVSGDVTEVAR